MYSKRDFKKNLIFLGEKITRMILFIFCLKNQAVTFDAVCITVYLAQKKSYKNDNHKHLNYIMILSKNALFFKI